MPATKMRDQSSNVVEMQGCEHCSKEFPLETMRMMEDCWFCEACTNEFQEAFDTCKHKWSPYTDTMGDPGQVCEKCSGFVNDDDFPLLFGVAAPPRP